ncbi:Protein mms22 [Pleurostoma richardsiae]|uniref:Protein mms22 n=1 Tax=Pleurostoma richardsiae TaxID=41990 RepID=A0AA38RSZ6_9PEZI|nr:Protein mms22 [Pleurostoma richardsiae]
MRSLNAGQLGKVFDQLDMDSVGFDWAILTAAIETLEHFMSLVEKAMDEQYSNDSSVLDQDHLEEAVLFLDQKLAGPLFSMARVILALPKEVDPAISQDQTTCVEKVISLASRVASRFIHSGVTRLLPYFKPGKYSLFEELPTKLDLQRLRYLSLFLAILVKNNIFDFRDIGTTIFELWMSSIAKPRAALCYETYLGEMLKLHNFPYLEETVLPPGERPDYNLARDLFSSGVAYMRKSLRSAEPPRRRQLRSDYAKILRLVMDQIKQHLKALVRIPAEHHHYVNFVRGIIATIKSHGADICPVDAFYYQPSQEYGPCVEDPQLHTAGIIAYGIRLIEADVTAVPQLFYYLYNNFKVAMANGLLDEECKILQNGMSNPSVFSFVLGKMVPAVIRATAQAHEAWPLLDVYVTALQKLSTKSCLPRELPDGSINDLSCLLRSVLQWATDKRASSDMTTRFSPVELYILVRILTLCNMFHGSLQSWHTMPLTTQTAELARLVENVTDLADAALFYLEELYGLANGEMKFDALFARDLLGGAGQEDTGEPGMLIVGDKDPHVESFSKHIAADVRKNWVVTSGIITVRLPAKPPSPSATQSGQGTKHRLGTGREILEDLCQELRLWTLRIGRRRRGRPVRPTWRHFRMPIF